MSLVSMTWPEYLAGCCRINGHLTRLTLQETDVVLALLLGHPERWRSTAELVETIWPNANTQPEDVVGIIHVVTMRLRRRGMTIEGHVGRDGGYRIPREARGRPERLSLAA